MLESISEVVNKARTSAGNVNSLSPKKQYTSFMTSAYKALGEVAVANSGRISKDNIPVKAIDPKTYSAWVAANPGKKFEDLTGRQKESLLAQSIQTFKKWDSKTQSYVPYTQEEALGITRKLLDDVEKNPVLLAGQPASLTLSRRQKRS